MNNPILSVITVSYNAVSTIEKTILSIVDQATPWMEYIIIDGGSTDGTVDIIKKYEDRISYWISESDAGIYDAMNKGTRVAKGDFLYFIGADDILCVDFNKLFPRLKDSHTIYYGDVLMQPSNKVYDGHFSIWKIVRKNICHQAIFYPHSVFDRYKYNCDYRVYADYYLNLQCFADPDLKFYYLGHTIAIYNSLGFSSGGLDPLFKADYKNTIISLFGRTLYWYTVLFKYLYRIKAFCVEIK